MNRLLLIVLALLAACASRARAPRDVAAEQRAAAARFAHSDVVRVGTDGATPVLLARKRRDVRAEHLAAAYPLDYPRPGRTIRLVYLRGPGAIHVARVDWTAARERLRPINGDAIRHGKLLLLGDGGGLWVYDLRRRRLRRIVTLAMRSIGPMQSTPHYVLPTVRWSDDASPLPDYAYIAVDPRTLRWRQRVKSAGASRRTDPRR